MMEEMLICYQLFMSRSESCMSTHLDTKLYLLAFLKVCITIYLIAGFLGHRLDWFKINQHFPTKLLILNGALWQFYVGKYIKSVYNIYLFI
jgi:hypothetical protein